MLKKRLLTVLMVLNAFSGLMPGMLLAAPKKQEICFELAQEQYKDHLSEKEAQDFVKKADRLCATQKQTGKDFEILIWSALIGGSKNAKDELQYLVNAQWMRNPSFKQDRVFLPRWVESHIVVPSVIGLWPAAIVGAFLADDHARWEGLKSEFPEMWSSMQKAHDAVAKSSDRATAQAEFNAQHQKMFGLLTRYLWDDFDGKMTEANKEKMLTCIDKGFSRSSTTIAWAWSAAKVAGVVCAASWIASAIEKNLQERNERAAKAAFDEFMQKPDAHILLAQKLNEFCVAR